MASDIGYVFKVTECSNYDGDSLTLTLDLGFNISIEVKARLGGIDTPELRDKRPEWKEAAILAKHAVKHWVYNGDVNSVHFVCTGKGKYGRWLGDLLKDRGEQPTLAEHLIAERLAVPYFGENKAEVEAMHQENIHYLFHIPHDQEGEPSA